LKWESLSRTFLSFASLILIICSATLPVLALQYSSSQRISSLGTINYSTTAVIFKDDFSNTLSDWTIESGVWTIDDGKLPGTASDNQRIVILYKGDVGVDYEITVKVYIMSSASTRPEGQIAFRHESVGNYYFAGIGAYGYKAAIGTFIDGRPSMLAYGGLGNYQEVQQNIWYNLKITAVRNEIKVYVNDELICSVTDNGHTTGKVGLTAIHSSVYFDDFIVRGSMPSISRLRVEGTQIKDQFGRRVYLKGVNFMSDFWWYEGRGTEQQFVYMKNWGVNVVRIVIECWEIEQGLMNNPSFLTRLDNMISWAEKYGMYVVLDGWHLSGSTANGVYRHDTAKYMVDKWDDWIKQWKTLATRYKGRTNILYDLLNEPLQLGTYENYQTKMRQAIDTIRAIDPDVVIIVEEMSIGSWDKMGFHFEQTNPIDRPNVIFSGHRYGSQPSGHQDIPTKEAIRSSLSVRKWDWMLKNNRAVWIGEFGAYNNDGLSATEQTWLRNFMTVLNEDGYSGYAAWQWGDRGWYYLLADWNGNPSDYGKIVQEFL